MSHMNYAEYIPAQPITYQLTRLFAMANTHFYLALSNEVSSVW